MEKCRISTGRVLVGGIAKAQPFYLANVNLSKSSGISSYPGGHVALFCLHELFKEEKT